MIIVTKSVQGDIRKIVNAVLSSTEYAELLPGTWSIVVSNQSACQAAYGNKWTGCTDHAARIITINADHLDRPPLALMTTVIHELLHAYNGTSTHGEAFYATLNSVINEIAYEVEILSGLDTYQGSSLGGGSGGGNNNPPPPNQEEVEEEPESTDPLVPGDPCPCPVVQEE